MGNNIMNDQVEEDPKWIERLINKTAKCLGKDFEDMRYDMMEPDDSFFLSNMSFVNITANSNDDNVAKKTVSVVVKRPPMMAKVREIMKTDALFHNEILFYRKFAKGRKDLPRCIYMDEKPRTEYVLVMENIGQKGYQLSEYKYGAPLEYTLAAIKEIARFHAKAYAMKEHHREKFFEFVRNIWETRYDDDPQNPLRNIVNVATSRSIDYLRKHGHDKDFCDKLEVYFGETYDNVLLKSVHPEEPLATLCHGDFTLNNTFFKRENGELKAMLIDFALIRYGSPVIDLSTYLCLHCAEELDKEMLGNILKVYHESLTQCLKEESVDCEKYSFEALHEDFKKKCLFGFVISSFFLCTLMGKNEISPEEMMEMDMKLCGELIRDVGGDEISGILARLLLQLKEFGCLDHVL